MLQNFFSKLTARPPIPGKPWMGIALPAWVFIGFLAAEFSLVPVSLLLHAVGISLKQVNPSILETVLGAVVYVLSIAFVIGLPWLVRRYRTTRAEIGLHRLLLWREIPMVLVGFVGYIFLSNILAHVAALLPFYDANQVQDTGFGHLSQNYEYLLAFVTLVLIAPFAEETLFRGYLLGKLRKYVPLWVAILITSLLFAIVHFQFNVGVDVFALSIMLCLLRVYSGSLWPSILLHMTKNCIAYYFLFINPSL